MISSRCVALLVMLVPAMALTSAVGGPAVIYLTALISLAVLASNAFTRRQLFDFRELMPMAVALFAPFTAMLISSIWLGVWSASEIEKLLRFALAVPVCWMLLRAPRHWLQHVQWSVLFGAYAGSIMLFVILLHPGLGRGFVSDYGGRYNAVAFADLTLLFGVMSIVTLPWTLTRWARFEAALKIFALPLTLAAVWVSQTRSSWGLLPVCGVVFLLAKRGWTVRKKAIFVACIAAVLALGAVAAWHAKGTRWTEAASDVSLFTENKERDTSVGIRMQLWHASWLMFKQSPLVGVGVPNFRPELVKMAEQGTVTKLVSTDFGEPHNDYLGALAGYGLLGILSIFALYFVPAAVFMRRMRSDDVVVRVGAQLGLLFCLGYSVFSLSEMMFRNMRSVPIYAVTVVLLYALTTVRRNRSQASSASA